MNLRQASRTIGRRRDVSGAGCDPPGPPLGALLKLVCDVQAEKISVVQWLGRNVGKVAVLRLPMARIVVVAEPHVALAVLRDQDAFPDKGIGLREARYFLGDGLLSASTGKAWSRSRSAFGKLFSPRNAAWVSSLATQMAEAEIRSLRNEHRDGEVDVYPAVERVALRTIGHMLFGPKFDSVAHAVHADLKVLSRWAEERIGLPIDPVTYLSWTISSNVRKARFRLYEILHELAKASSYLPETIVGSVPAEERADDGDFHNQLCTLLLAGYETTAAASAWSLMLMAGNAEAYEAVSEEGQSSEAERELPATIAVLKEAMRLYPPVWAITRRARNVTVVGGFRFPRSSNVLINIVGIHRDPALWDRSDEFIPTRFGSGKEDPQFYLPFGVGMRRCVGLHMGLAEACRIISRFSVHLHPCRGDLEPIAGLVLRPRGAVPMRWR